MITKKDADLIAFVGLKDKAVAYIRVEDVPQTLAFHPRGYSFPGKFKRRRFGSIADYPVENVLVQK